jgi:hypothetical protein
VALSRVSRRSKGPNNPPPITRTRNARSQPRSGVHISWSTRPAANQRPPRWQGDAGVDFIEEFRPKRSYRCVSVNSGGSAGGGNREPAKLAMRIADEHRSSAREPALRLAIPGTRRRKTWCQCGATTHLSRNNWSRSPQLAFYHFRSEPDISG